MAYTIDMSSGSETPSKRWSSRITSSAALKVLPPSAARSPSAAASKCSVKPRRARSSSVPASVPWPLVTAPTDLSGVPSRSLRRSALFGKAAQLDRQLERRALAQKRDLDARAGRGPDDAAGELLRRADLLVVDGDDDVALLDAS